MIYRLEVTAGPEAAVGVAEAKAHLRVDHALDDDTIRMLIQAAQAQAEDLYLWQALTPRTYSLTTDGVAAEILLPMGPVTAVTLVESIDAASVATELAVDAWRLQFFEPGRLLLLDLPASATSIRVTYTAGLAEAPAWAKQAILLMVGHWYEQRQAVDVRPGAGAMEIPLGVRALLLGRRAW